MSGPSPFQPRVLAALGAALVSLFAASLLLTGAGGNRSAGNSIGANTYSHSAVGQLGFFDVLQKLGYHAVRGEQNVTAMLGPNGVLVLAEPTGRPLGEDDNLKLLRARTILVVLPKWNIERSEERDDWIGGAELAPESLPESVLSAVAVVGDVIRVAAPPQFGKSIAVPDPSISGDIQLIAKSKMTPLVWVSDGILLGEIKQGDRRIWVLADPDPIENHGIGRGDNITFAKGMVDGVLAGKSGPLVFDETIHGFQRSGANPLKFLFEFPFNLIAGQVTVAVVLLLLAAMGRFGTPEIPERILHSGKRDLISNAASLIDHAGHHVAIFKRYASMVLQDTARSLRAPRRGSEAELAAWLDKAAASRGIPSDWRDALVRVDAAKPRDLSALLGEARTLHRWKKDILNGISGRLGDN